MTPLFTRHSPPYPARQLRPLTRTHRSSSEPNPPADSYLYSPFKDAAAPRSDGKPPRHGGVSQGAGSAWSESFHDASVSMVGRERERGILAGGSRREQVSQAPVWLSRTDSASSNSSYGGGSRPLSYGSVGEGFDDDQQQQQQFSRFATQPQPRPLSGRRALPPAPLSPMSALHGTPGSGVSQQPMPFQTHENDHDRRPIHMPRPPAAGGAAAAAASSLASEQVPQPTNKHQTTNPKPQSFTLPQRAWSASAALAGTADTDATDRAGTGQPAQYQTSSTKH